MPERGNDFCRHHIIRQYPLAVKVLSPTIGIEEPPRVQIPTKIPQILVWIVEWCVPPARAQLVSILRISERAPYEAHLEPSLRAEYFWRSNVDTADTHVERILPHIAVHRADQLGLTVLLDTHGRAPAFSFHFSYRLSTYFVDLLLDETGVAALRFKPTAALFMPLVFVVRNNNLQPYLFLRFKTAQKLNDSCKRINLIFLLRIFVELVVDVGAQRICVTPRLISMICRVNLFPTRIIHK